MSVEKNPKTRLIQRHFGSAGLPVAECIAPLCQALTASPMVALKAPPGSGKTILLPSALLEARDYQRVLVLEPRRITARLPALALKELLGDFVGYKIRLESQWSEGATKVGYLTYGTALRLFMESPPGPQELVVFDEFHERSWEAELLLAYLRSLPEPPPLLLMSATLDVESLPPDLPVIESDGRLHPVTVSWEPIDPQILGSRDKLAALVARRSLEWAAKERGEQLIFLPGMAHIRKADLLLQSDPLEGPVDILHSTLDEAEIRRVVERPAGAGFRRILSTDLAESSVTLPGIKVVLDAGLVRRPIRDQLDLGVTLRTQGAPRSALQQRAGRAGRVGPGFCHRLFTRAEELHRPEFGKPELEQADYKTLVLFLAAAGLLPKVENLPWLYPPDSEKLQAATRWCREQTLLTGRLTLTEAGRQVLSLPVEPRIANFCYRARKGGLPLYHICQWALALEQSPPQQEALSLDQWTTLLGSRGQDKRLLSRLQSGLANLQPDSDSTLEEILVCAYSDTLCQLTGDRAVAVDPAQPALHFAPSHPEKTGTLAVLLGASPRGGQGPRSAATLYQIVPPELVWEFHFESLQERETLFFDQQTSSVKSRKQTILGSLVLEEEVGPATPGERAGRIFLENLSGAMLGEAFRTLSRRLQLLFQTFPTKLEELNTCLETPLQLESLDTDLALLYLKTISSWTRSSPEEMETHIKGLLPYPLQQTLERELPSTVSLPRRRKPVPITYPPEGVPYIASKLQDFFGWEPPTLANGKINLVCHLLAPNGRACQITTNLEEFWKGSYQQVRKDLRGRYPKHDWPENP